MTDSVDMTQTVIWGEREEKYRFEYLIEDARLLGEILVDGAAQSHLQKVERVAVHRVHAQRFLTVSGGKPFAVKTYELRNDEVGTPLPGDLPGVTETRMNLVFTAENTGDGITYFFKDSSFLPLTQVVVNVMKERARIF